MSEQKRVFLARLAAADYRIDGNAGKIAKLRQCLGIEGQRYQRRASGCDLEAEAPRQVMAETGRAHLGNRQASGGDDQ